MATFHDRTAALVCQRGLLRTAGRPCAVLTSAEVVALTADKVLAEMSAEIDRQEAERAELPPEPLLPAAESAEDRPLPHRDSLAAIRWELDGLLAHVPELTSITAPASLERATTLWRRQALERAMEHGAAMLDALGLPRLVGPDHIIVDPVAAGDALAAAIEALDALDADPDLEDGADDEETGDDEYSLGWREAVTQTHLGHGSDDGEHTLGAPERSPEPPPAGYCTRWGAYVDRSSDAAQSNWAQGGRHDLEHDPCDGPIDEDELDDDGIWRAEGDESEKEQDLGAPAGDGDQRHWAQGDSRGYEDVTEGDGQAPADWYKRPIGPVQPHGVCRDYGPECRAARRQAEATRRRVKGPEPRRDPDLLIMAGAGRAIWRRPTHTRDGVEVVGVVSR